MIDLSCIIITRNESKNILRCLHSLPSGAETIVVDSFSSDNTVELARSFGATVVQHDFDNYASQKNRALSLAHKSWVLSVDADEVLSADLASWLTRNLKSQSASGMLSRSDFFRIERRMVFMNQVLRFGKSKDSPLRLFRRDKAKFYGEVHEFVGDIAGKKITSALLLKNETHLLHFSYENLSDYFQKFNRYTSLVALQRRQDLKKHRLSFLTLRWRPWGVFIYRYFFRLGLFDGYPGYCWALFAGLYSFVKYAKAWEADD